MSIRFLHAADLHLGLRITRFNEEACKRIGEARFKALDRLKAKAAELAVDFVLIAGDLFDDHSVSLTAISERTFKIFEGKGWNCPVYIIPGNHDPLSPGGVWEREPWKREQPILRVHFLRTPEPVAVPEKPVALFPCPLRHRKSLDDPTEWIAKHPRAPGDETIRIGLAHGSLNALPNLPPDDHLIRRDAADAYDLDYLALGHWHKPFSHKSADGIVRTAYCGTHEPMRFPGVSASLSTGWTAYSADEKSDLFADDGHGWANLVTIDAPRAAPRIEPIEIGYLHWISETCDLTSHSLGELTGRIAALEPASLTILRLKLTGVLDLEKHAKIDEELRAIVDGRFHVGSRVDADELLGKPNDGELRRLVGDGVLSRVLNQLELDFASPDAPTKRLAGHAIKQLYKIVAEEARR